MTLTLDIDTRTLSDGERSVHLSRQRCRFLEILARAPQGYTAHVMLIAQIWHGDGPEQPDNTLKVVVSTVRAAAPVAQRNCWRCIPATGPSMRVRGSCRVARSCRRS